MMNDNDYVFCDFSSYLLKHLNKGTLDDECLCRMSSYLAQDGCCYITGKILVDGKRQMHHRNRRYYGGKDTAENTFVMNNRIHRLVHAKAQQEIGTLLTELNLTHRQLRFVNQLRFESHMPALNQNAIDRAA